MENGEAGMRDAAPRLPPRAAVLVWLPNRIWSERVVIVIFEYVIKEGQAERYFDLATQLMPLVETFDGFLGVERYQSRTQPNRYLSHVLWRDEAAIEPWRNHPNHRAAQELGKAEIFEDFRITVVNTVRSYTMSDRDGEPTEEAMKALA